MRRFPERSPDSFPPGLPGDDHLWIITSPPRLHHAPPRADQEGVRPLIVRTLGQVRRRRRCVELVVEAQPPGVHLLPRQLTQSGGAQWVFCFACDTSALGTDVRIVAQGASGLRFVEVVG